MQRILRWCILLSTVLVVMIFFSDSFDAHAQDTGTIKGKVTGDGNVALANVTVKVYYQENVTGIIVWTYGGQATTDSTGAYTIANLNAGTYHVSFNEYPPVAGYFPEFYNNASTQENATDITLAAGATVNNINAQLSSGAHIKGQVTDLQGNPLSNISVFAFDTNHSAQADQYFITGADGRYDIGHIQPGSYFLEFKDRRIPRLYRTEFFDNQHEVANSTFVTLAAEQTLSNINAQLDRLGFITGKVTDLQNNPLSNIELIAQHSQIDEFGETWSNSAYGMTDGSGNYVLGGLVQGAYRIQFNDTRQRKYSREYYNDSVDPTLFTPVTVTLNTTTTNINAQLALRGGITGRITNKQGVPLNNIEVTAEELDVNRPAENRWDVVSVTRSNANGDYALCCLDAGDYRLRFADTQNQYLNEYYNNVYYDYRSTLNNVTLVQVTANLTTTNVNAELSPFSNLVINVTDQRGQPITGLKATLFRSDLSGSGEWYDTFIQAEGMNKGYHIGTIPGLYRLRLEDGRNPERYTSEFYNDAADLMTAMHIVLTEAATTTISAVLADKTRIDGRVTDRQGNALPNIEVGAWQLRPSPDSFWGEIANTRTDEGGYYSLSALTPGTYRVGFAIRYPPDTFAGEFYQGAAYVHTATDVIVTESVATLNIDAQLGRPSHLSGQVTDMQGTPLSNIYVYPYRYTYDKGQFTWYLTGSTQTDVNGVYTSEALAPGQYRIGFQDYSNTYHSAFYNQRGYLENASTITLTTEMTMTDINVQLPANPFFWPPFAQDDQIIVDEGSSISILTNGYSRVIDNDRGDGRPLQASIAVMPTHGTLNLSPDGGFIYTHNGDEATSDFFTYRVSDGTQTSNVAQVFITIQPINDPPVVRNDSLTVARGQSSTTLDTGAKSLLTNDSDPDSAVLTATLKSGPAHGAVTINANGTFTYTHDGSAGDSDSFNYQATDALGGSAVATVTVAINPFSFSKMVSIAGIKPLCTAVAEMRVPVGTTIVYCYTIHNLGDVALNTHTLIDSHLGTLLTNHSRSVTAGATFSVTFTQTLTLSTTNIATWTVTSLTGQNVTLAPPSATAKRAATITIASATDDSDGDGIPDNLEKAGDLDGDNLPNFLDTDADGDGILDKDEVGSNPLQPLDSNQNGIPDYLENVNSGGEQKLFLPVVNR